MATISENTKSISKMLQDSVLDFKNEYRRDYIPWIIISRYKKLPDEHEDNLIILGAEYVFTIVALFFCDNSEKIYTAWKFEREFTFPKGTGKTAEQLIQEIVCDDVYCNLVERFEDFWSKRKGYIPDCFEEDKSELLRQLKYESDVNDAYNDWENELRMYGVSEEEMDRS